ncbi:hypothetical protein [Roseinatronobacter sp. NSM]|uniref:hypothetical protein n=1 Tax=Roseinatronobacter sp. NSM TaxID=3457785 RepID=UPI004035ECAD
MAEYRVQKVRDAFLVLNAEGERVGPFWTNELAAERERQRMQEAFDIRLKRVLRPCLCCEAQFHSQGIHNRLCDACKAHANALGREMTG